MMAVGGWSCAVEDIESASWPAEKACSSTTTGGHGSGVEDGCSVAAVEDLVETLHGGFEKAVDLVRSSKLEEGTEDLRCAEV